MLIVGTMTRPGRELAKTHRPQLPAQSLLGHPDAVLLPQPLRQIDQAPAHHPVNGRDRSALDHAGEFLPLGVVELRRPSRRLAIDEASRPLGIEPQHPIADRLQPNPPIRAASLRETRQNPLAS
jgi:hypothetical protein